jgi:NAD(P)-dependent dehydrogenase (short-subunit alcohol dehydrogenase family)
MVSASPPSPSFDGRVIIVTGASAGLGKAYAQAFARNGARVLVHGRSEAVTQIVAEIRAQGGEAEACVADVREGGRIAQCAMDHWGRIDALVANAGVVRDRSFAKMSQADWDEVLQVHLSGSFACTRAVWPQMLNQQYGRIVLTTSSAGFFGNFGQANYAAAKAALIGFARTLALEGKKHGVQVNALAPIGSTRMNQGLLGEAERVLDPARVAPVVLALCHERMHDTGLVIESGGGWVAALRWQRSAGVAFDPGVNAHEALLDRWSEVPDFSAPEYPESTADTLRTLINVHR